MVRYFVIIVLLYARCIVEYKSQTSVRDHVSDRVNYQPIIPRGEEDNGPRGCGGCLHYIVDRQAADEVYQGQVGGLGP